MIHQHHPIRKILDVAVNGQRPTRHMLDQAFKPNADAPHDVNLDRLRREVVVAAEEVAVIANANQYVNQKRAAVERSEEHLARFDDLMTDDEHNLVLLADAFDSDDIDYDALARDV